MGSGVIYISPHAKATRDNNNIYGAWWVKCADGDCSWRTAGNTEAEAITAWNTRSSAPPPATGLVAALELFQSFGCPLCNGDCGSANPPVTTCPMQIARAALTAHQQAQPADGGEVEQLRAENARLRAAIADHANSFNVAGSPYDQAIQALDAMVAETKRSARVALTQEPHP